VGFYFFHNIFLERFIDVSNAHSNHYPLSKREKWNEAFGTYRQTASEIGMDGAKIIDFSAKG